MKKNKSFRFQLTFSTSLIIMSFIGIFSLILLIYMTYYLLIIVKIYTMAEDVMTPIASIIILLLFILAITALISSIICGITISDKYLKTVNKFNNNVKQIKKDGLKHRLQIDGNDELGQLGKEFNDVLDQLEKQGYIAYQEVEDYRNPYSIHQAHQEVTLTKDQQSVVNGILSKPERVSLIHGVTGSGKTEVYLALANEMLKQKKTVIMLVPEISLTPMMVDVFKKRFGDNVAILHSRLSQGEKYDEYRRIKRQEVQIVVGARSAVFAPPG